MILNKLSNYLQNQPFKVDSPQATEAVASTVLPNQNSDSLPEELSLSERASYLEYLSQQFDVTSLDSGQLNQLQSKLHDYGFISANDMNGMSSLSLARQLGDHQEQVNAVDLLDN